jgi:hypothetical protein
VQEIKGYSLPQHGALHSDDVAGGVRAAAVVPAQVAQHPRDGSRCEARPPHRHQLTHLLHLLRQRRRLVCIYSRELARRACG